MLRIDEPNNDGGMFRIRAPGQPATRFGEKWPNTVQEELVAVALAKTGATLDQDGVETGQVLEAINWLIAQAVTAASDALAPHVTQLLEGKWMMSDDYDGTYYKLPDGASYLRADYPAAWTAIQASGMLAADGTEKAAQPGMWGPGDGATTFQMPDLRDQFLRVYKEAKGGALGPALGHFKANQNKSHHHSLPSYSNDDTGDGAVADSTGTAILRTANTGDQGGDEAVPDHISVRFVIRLK